MFSTVFISIILIMPGATTVSEISSITRTSTTITLRG